MGKKILLLIVIFFLVLLYMLGQEPGDISQSREKGKLFIYFMGEEAGYEEYEWIEQTDRYILFVKGEMTKPISLITSDMVIEVDKEFKPLRFRFKGVVNGVNQEIDTIVTGGEAKNTIKAGEQTREFISEVSTDALFLPNGIFSPYVVVAEKTKAPLEEKITIPAYVVPQLELKMSVEPDKEDERRLHLSLMGVKIELQTGKQGKITSLSIPSQSLEVYGERFKKEEEKPSEEVEGIHHELVIAGKKLGKGFYSIHKKGEDILIKGRTQQVIEQVSLNFQFEEVLSSEWNLKEAHLAGKVNDEDVEMKAEVEGEKIKVFLKEGEKTREKQMLFSSDVIFSTENFLLDNFLLVKKMARRQKKKFYSLGKLWGGSYYFDEPVLIPITIEKEGQEILEWPEGELKAERYFMDLAGSNGGYTWAEKDGVLKTSFPLAAMEVYNQDYAGLKTKEITSPEIISDKYISEEVNFSSGELKLAGTLTIPKDNLAKHPAAVLITGSGPQDRNEDTVGPGGLKFGIFKQIAHQLSENKIAVLRYDDRGTGKSEGNFVEAVQEDLIQDVKAAVSYLRTRDDILEDKIVLIGHSEGAIIAPRVAADDAKIKAIVLLAGTAETGDKILREQFYYLLDYMELSEGEKEKIQVNYENVFKIINGEHVDKEVEGKLKPQLEPQLKWLRSFVNYDPLSVLDKIKAPVLIINGGKDKQVFPHHAQMLYKRLKELDKTVRLKIFPDLNHLLIPSETGSYAEYTRQSMQGKKISQELLNYLLGWLHGVLFAKKVI